MVCALRSGAGSSNKTRKREARVGVKHGSNILIGTPGRVKTLLQRSTISLKNAGCFVFDDVEQMLEMQGFRRDVERIEGKFDMKHKSERQTLVFSTKFSQEIQQMAGLLMRDDYKVIKCAFNKRQPCSKQPCPTNEALRHLTHQNEGFEALV